MQKMAFVLFACFIAVSAVIDNVTQIRLAIGDRRSHGELSYRPALFEYVSLLTRGLPCFTQCNILAFQANADDISLFKLLNDGRTIFVNDRRKNTTLNDTIFVDYRTKNDSCIAESNNLEAKYWNFLPAEVANIEWHVVFIGDIYAGKLQPLWWFAKYAAARPGVERHVVLSQAEHYCAKYLGEQFLTNLFQSDPITFSLGETYAHWSIVARPNTLAHGLMRSIELFPLFSVTTREIPFDPSDCLVPLRESFLNSLVSNGGMKRDDIIHLEVPVERRLHNGFGRYGSAGFRFAVLLKSRLMQSALRLGRDILLSDIDIYYRRPLPLHYFKSLLTRFPHLQIIAQAEPLSFDCPKLININTGFYVIRASTWSLKFLHDVLAMSHRSTHTEQIIWNRKLNQINCNRTATLATCRNASLFEFLADDCPFATLPIALYPNGYWLKNDTSKAYLQHFNFMKGYCEKHRSMVEFAAGTARD